MSSILAPATDPKPEGQKDELPPRDAEGKFTSPEQKAPEGLPEKYQGKTPEEIAEMHRNAEKELGRLRNEIGNYRGLVNDLTTLQRKAPEPQSVEPEKIDVSGDELLTDPGSAIDKVVSQRLAEREAKEAELAAQERVELEGRALLQSFPDLDTIVTSTEFQEFASRTPSRQQDFLTAAQGEGIEQVRAARRLMEDFDDFQNASAAPSGPAKQDPQPGVAAAKAVSNEGGGPAGAVSTKPLIHETDVLKLIASDPAKYRSPSFQKELMDAMREGRYVKQ
jgi:hypothetical protein